MRKHILVLGLLLGAAMAPAFGVSVGWNGLREEAVGKYKVTTRVARFADGPVATLADQTLSRFVLEERAAFVQKARKETKNPNYPMAPWEYLAGTTVSVAKPDLVSAFVTTYAFQGGAHGMTTYKGVNVGLVNGRAKNLRLEDLFGPGVSARTLAVEAVKERLIANERAAWFQPGEDPAYRPKDSDLIKEFVITPSGLTFLLEPYVAGPYSAGSFFAKVPFTAFGNNLNPNGPVKNLL